MDQRALFPKGPLPVERDKLPAKTKTSRSCDRCRQKRIKCDGLTPACSNCLRQEGTRCDYSGLDRRKKDHWATRVEALEKRNEHLEKLVRELSCNQPTEAPHPLPQLSGDSGPAQDDALSGPADTERISETDDLIQIFYNATAAHPTMLPSTHEIPDATGSSRLVDLPPKSLARIALDAFFNCASTLFYIMTPREAEDLLERVYSEQGIQSDDLCELCALAAIGSHYEINKIPDEARATFFYIATTALEKLAQTSKLQGMRVFICLCIASIMDKTTNARMLIMSALNIARRILKAHLLQTSRDAQHRIEYARTLQTIIFFESWLSYSLGYRSDVHGSEINLTRILDTADQPGLDKDCPITRNIQLHMAKLSLIASNVYQQMSAPGQLLWDSIGTLLEHINHWHRTLPPEMHLSVLNRMEEEKITKLHERALYLMHGLFMDTCLLVYCRVIKSQWRAARSQDGQACLELLFKGMPEQIHTEYTQYAIQLSRTVSLLHAREYLMTRCWVAIQAAFDAGLMLLLSICQNHYTSRQVEPIPQLLEKANACIAVLEFCGARDIAAHRLFSLSRPLYDGLVALSLGPGGAGGEGGQSQSQDQGSQPQPDQQSTHKMRIGYLMETDVVHTTDLDLQGSACRLLDLLVPRTNQIWV
ncbi:hypothetical protein BDW74DRAFT_181263 [Aspergillus multicolor]|uniref:uncharacterized protein n=1 Tax=Aspergillus multicolor TaxID=41759 RepID=UPI003CCDE2B2